MNLFLDTEFADLEAGELVSVALVSEDGEQVFYAERDPLPSDATAFVREHVYPLLDRGAAALSDVALTTRLRAFLCALQEPHIIYDYPSDWALLCWAMNGFGLSRKVTNECGPMPDVVVTLVQGGPVYDQTEAWFAAHPEAKRHHALVDERALCAAWISVNR